MRVIFFIILSFCCFNQFLNAQTKVGCSAPTNLEQMALKAYLYNDIDLWTTTIATANAQGTTAAHRLETAKILFGACGTAFSKEAEDVLDKWLDELEVQLDAILEENENHPEAMALYSGYLGMIIAQSPMKGMFYGRKASKMARKAVKLNPSSSVTHYFLGSNLYYTPSTWGGDPAEAVAQLSEAKANAPSSSDGCDWWHLQTHALLGQAQKKAGDKSGARQTYLAALQLQPDFYYVKELLLPALDKTK